MSQGARRSSGQLLEACYGSLLAALADLPPAVVWSPTRCVGWSVHDLMFHLLADAQRALVALHTPATTPADTDEVSYWRSWPPAAEGSDASDAGYRDTRLLASGWPPAALSSHVAATVRAVLVASGERSGDDLVRTQGKTLTVDALRSTLAVEATVHQLDLGLGTPAPAGLAEVRHVLDGLLGSVSPLDDDVRYALVGTGREPLTAHETTLLGPAADRLPLFG